MFIQRLKQLLKPEYDTLNRIEINRRAILANLELLRQEQANNEIIPVLKANAYGHGLAEIARILNTADIKMLAVDSFPEAQIAYRYSRAKVLLIGELPLKAYAYLNWKRTEVCVYNTQTLVFLAKFYPGVKIHLFINSGMNREGIKDVKKFYLNNSQYLNKLKVNGLCSHLADGEGDGKSNEMQLKQFLSALDFFESQGLKFEYVHLANSAGAFSVKHPRLNAFRPGLACYGYNPLPKSHPRFKVASKLQAALALYSKVISQQSLTTGEGVSYNYTFKAKKAINIAVIPFGYYEGLDRRLSNQAQFKIDEKYYQIAGNVCMNMTCLSLGNSTENYVGREVELISPNQSALNSVASLAALENTIPYEVLVRLQSNIRRIIIDK